MRTKPNKPFINNLRDMAYVPRWAIARRIRQQYLAEHSYFTAIYADQIARLIGWEGNYEDLFRYALYHDLDETVTGDIPGPAKRLAWSKEKGEEGIFETLTDKYGLDVSRARREATDGVRAIVSAADSIEELCYLSEELLLGNVWVHPVVIEAKERMLKRWMALPASEELLTELWDEYLDMLVIKQHNSAVLLKDTI